MVQVYHSQQLYHFPESHFELADSKPLFLLQLIVAAILKLPHERNAVIQLLLDMLVLGLLIAAAVENIGGHFHAKIYLCLNSFILQTFLQEIPIIPSTLKTNFSC